MPTSFMDFSGELRNHIYELVLVTEHPIRPLQGRRPVKHMPELLRADKIIHREASSIFYGQNQFDLVNKAYFNGPDSTIFTYLRKTGGNAALIRSLLVLFPSMKYVAEPDRMSIRKSDKNFLDKLRSFCPNVSKIMIPVASTQYLENIMCMRAVPIRYPQVICMINKYFSVFDSLAEITVLALDHDSDEGEAFYGRCCSLKEEMVSVGWKVQISESAVVKRIPYDDSEDSLSPYDSPDSDDDDDGDFDYDEFAATKTMTQRGSRTEHL